jgi:isoleucyl-tRNA synthetase
VIGASLEAAPVVHVADTAILAALKSINFAEACITSGIQLTGDAMPDEAFRLPDVAGVGVVFEHASGEKCQRCWQILPDVGSHKHAHTCKRCNEALG